MINFFNGKSAAKGSAPETVDFTEIGNETVGLSKPLVSTQHLEDVKAAGIEASRQGNEQYGNQTTGSRMQPLVRKLAGAIAGFELLASAGDLFALVLIIGAAVGLSADDFSLDEVKTLGVIGAAFLCTFLMGALRYLFSKQAIAQLFRYKLGYEPKRTNIYTFGAAGLIALSILTTVFGTTNAIKEYKGKKPQSKAAMVEAIEADRQKELSEIRSQSRRNAQTLQNNAESIVKNGTYRQNGQNVVAYKALIAATKSQKAQEQVISGQALAEQQANQIYDKRRQAALNAAMNDDIENQRDTEGYQSLGGLLSLVVELLILVSLYLSEKIAVIGRLESHFGQRIPYTSCNEYCEKYAVETILESSEAGNFHQHA